MTLAAAVTVVFIGFAVSRYGIVGAALVTTASQAAYLVYVAVAVRRPFTAPPLGDELEIVAQALTH